ncbi:MAG TPA: zf-HC2 domain-containing protein [Acidimicrobiia bacterium]|nr:zf-HC2 domain-containing protein [Acidimicrobiia bacterium]
MRCEQVREAISARLDGEVEGVAPAALAEHLDGCAECRLWQERAHEVTRTTRLGLARPPALRPDALVAGVLAHSRPPRRPTPFTWARLGLVLVGSAQAVVALPLLVAGRDHGSPEHVAHEMGAFAMALAVGFVLAAWKPERARGMHALVGAAAVLLVVTAALDLAHGRTDLGDEAPHLLAVAGWLLLAWLASATPSPVTTANRSRVPRRAELRHRRRHAGAGVAARLAPQRPARAGGEGQRRAG